MSSVRAAAIAAAFLAGLASNAAAQVQYVVDDLGALPGDTSSLAQGINANGDVVGWSNGPDGTRGFVYTNGAGMVALPGLPNRPRTIARDINDGGWIVGSANNGGVDLGHAVLWRNGAVEDLGTLAGPYSDGWAVNNAGQVVGSSYVDGGTEHAFLFTHADGMIDLSPTSDTSHARDINDAGQVTGYRYVGAYHAYRWQAGTMVDLGTVPGLTHSYGFAINAAGRVAGNASSASGNAQVVMRSTDNGLQSVGGVGETNVGWGINASGQIVGQGRPTAGLKRAFIYSDGAGLRDLNTLIDAGSGWFLLAAYDINDAGQIAAYGINNLTGLTHAVRLRPVTAPPPDCTYSSRACLGSRPAAGEETAEK
jgi:probable HAF family extracellular repeat protein